MLRNKNFRSELNLFSSLPNNISAIPTASHVIYGWLFAVACAVVLHITLLWQHDMIKAEDKLIKNELATIFNKITRVASDDDTADNSKLAGVVKAGAFIRHMGTYEYFYSLARIKNNKVWLTGISLDFEKSVIELVGHSLDSSSMYNMAIAIKGSEAYKSDNLGLQNVKKNITSEQSSVYDFSLTNMKATNNRRTK